MKHSIKHLCRSCVSMLMAICMICSMLPVGAWAASTPKPGVSGIEDVNNDGTITYVSFGDSVTNGYGMDGYRFSDGTNVLGFRQEPPASYPALIRDYLTEQGYTVDLEQMAISGFRMDELHWMLCDCYEADSYHNYQFANWNRSAIRRLLNSSDEEAKTLAAEIREKYQATYGSDANMIAKADEIIMNEYRDAVKNADLITIDLGTNNFGTFVTNTIQEILGLKDLDYEIDFTQYLDANTAASLEAMLGQMVANMVGNNSGTSYDLAMTLARCLMFGYLGYTENYDGAIEAIYELNPDAKVVVIDCYTMITGVQLEGGALGENIDLDALYDMFIDLANFYSRELSPYANKVTHATLDTAPELFIDYYKDYPDADYPDNQYVHPSAERLMNEFVMENMGYDPDEPAERETFNQNILSPIQTLDSYVNNLSTTIKSEVIDAQIMPQLNATVSDLEDQIDITITAIDLIYTAVEGVATAKEMLPTAIEGVEAARSAVDASVEGVAAAKEAVDSAVEGVAAAEAAVDTAIDGVATAESLLEIIVSDVVGNSMFSTNSSMKSIILSVIESKVSEMDLSVYGFSNDEETVAMISEEIYEVACLYVNEEEANGTAAAEKAATIEIMRFFLVESKGYAEEDAQATAELAYELNAIYEAEGKPAAIKAAIETEVTDELMATLGTTSKTEAAEMVYYLGTTDTETAVKAAIATQMTEEKLEELGLSDMTAEEAAALVYELGTLAETDYKAAVIKAMTLKVEQATAELAYAMVNAYEAVLADGGTEAEAEEAAVLVAVAASLTDENMEALATFGITEREAAAEMVYQVTQLYNATYAETGSDKQAVVTCLVTLAGKLGIDGIDKATASTGYDLYAGVYAPAIEAGKTEDEAKALTVIAAIKTQYSEPEGLAEGIYAVYKGTATKEQEQLVYYTLLVAAGISADVAEAICICYINELDGQYNNEYVQTTMIFFMTQALGMTAEEAAENYKSYLTYKNLPTTLSKIAKVDTIYFDALLNATAGGNLDLSAVAEEFMAGTLVLEKPAASEAEDPEAWAEYKSDSALATLFFRFMSQDGIYTHPSEAGQKTLFNAAKGVLDSLLTAEADEKVVITDTTNLLVLGDFIAADENSYVSQVAEKLDVNYTNLARADYRINDVRALLDDIYTGDAYHAAVAAAETADFKSAVANSDVILVNLGSMNMGMIAKQLSLYMSEETAGQTYSMEFSDIGNMQIQNLGKTMDAFLSGFSGAFGTDEIGALMLAFETYGYGYTTFADCLDNTIETIQALNPDADIVLVGMYDLLGDAYIRDSSSGMYLEMGHFIGHAVNLMNQHMMTYAEMTDNVTYVDVTDIETNALGKVNMMDGGVSGIAAAFGSATPTAAGYASMAQKIACHLGGHTPENAEDITWGWNADYTATASFTCTGCGEAVTVNARISSATTAATCEAEGQIIYTASYAGFTWEETTTEILAPIAHNYTAAWTWADDYTSASVTLTCTNNQNHTVAVDATVTSETTVADCENTGKTVYTATAVYADVTYTDVKESSIPVTGHSFGEWAQTKAPTCTEPGEETRTCANCGETETQPVAALGHSYESSVTAPTCTEGGYTTYTCSICGDAYITDETPATGHSYGENGKCTACGAVDPEAHPVCEYTVAETLVSGNSYILSLGGTQVGTYTFTEVDGGWTIQAADGTYLAIEDETLVNSSNAFTWTYSNGSFSAVVETESSNNWFGSWFGSWWGSSSEETYYLVASGSGVGISTSSTGSDAAFYTAHSDVSHNFNAGTTTAPTCTEGGYTTYTCDRCGYSYTGSYTEALGHSYEAAVTAPTCTEDGYTTYTCSTCGDSYVDSYVEALGHNYVDGVCTNCGHDTNKPVEPEIPEGECAYLAEQTLTSGGSYILSLGGNQVGTYTFTQVSGGWTIQAADGTYLALENKALVSTSAAFTWTYSNGYFSTTVETESTGNNWWGGWLGNWWGSGSSEETYYLVSSGSNVTVSTSTSAATAKFYLEVTGEHVYGDPIASNGSHVFTCINCGNEMAKTCTDPDCELCNPVVPEATINVSVSISSKSSGNNWFGGIFGNWWGSSTTYTATITVEAEGTEVDSVAYSTDGGSTWTEGTSFESSSEITAFDIRVEATNGVTYYFAYSNGTVTQVG